jgi:hypothetical protein
MQSYANFGCGIVRPGTFAPFAGLLTLPGGGGQTGRSVPISQVACLFDP